MGRPRWIGTSTGTRLLVGVSEAGAVSIRPDGTGATVLPNTAGRGFSGVGHDLFADGRAARAVLGESTTSGQWSNLAVDLMPSGSQRLMDTPFIDEGAPSLSPDGSEIAFLVEGRPSVIRTDGTGQRSITPDTSYTYGPPAWSADGTRIGFVARSPRANSQAALYSVQPDGSDFARHTASRPRRGSTRPPRSLPRRALQGPPAAARRARAVRDQAPRSRARALGPAPEREGCGPGATGSRCARSRAGSLSIRPGRAT